MMCQSSKDTDICESAAARTHYLLLLTFTAWKPFLHSISELILHRISQVAQRWRQLQLQRPEMEIVL